MCFLGVEQWEVVAERQRDCADASYFLETEPGRTMTGTPLESGRVLISEQVLLRDLEKEEVYLTVSPPDTHSQSIVLDMEHSCGTPMDAKADEDGVAAKGTKAPGPTQCKGSISSEDQPTCLESAQEDLSHSQTVWAEEGDPEPPLVSPNKLLAASCLGEGQLLSTVPQEEEEEEVLLACLAVEEESFSIRVEQELPREENIVEMEHNCLLETRGWALSREEPGIITQSCCVQTEDDSTEEQECPICTELYDKDKHRPALLNCSHVLCDQCLRSIMEASSAADIGRVRCPICRQKTPMMEWEICKLQEEMLLMNSEQGPAVAPPTFTALPARRPGIWGGLEHHFQVRFHTTRMVGFLPCLRYPPALISGLARLEQRCRCCYRLALVALLISEMLSLLLVFLPIVLLLLLFLILDK